MTACVGFWEISDICPGYSSMSPKIWASAVANLRDDGFAEGSSSRAIQFGIAFYF